MYYTFHTHTLTQTHIRVYATLHPQHRKTYYDVPRLARFVVWVFGCPWGPLALALTLLPTTITIC